MTLYTTGPVCDRCRATRALLDGLGIPYREVDLSDPDNRALRVVVVDVLGYTRVPVVVPTGDSTPWAGFRPDLLTQLIGRLHEEESRP
ncbi:glutaredoxin family protein [Microbacter sp. GSS18]|nr:glutaredoxin family protein [Microbacter sp. GSS18]